MYASCRAAGPPPPAELGLSVGVSTHGDLVLRGLLMMIHDGHSLHAAASQAEVALTVVCNISPYIKATSQAAMLSLLSLFDKLARPVAKACASFLACCASDMDPNVATELVACRLPERSAPPVPTPSM